MESPSLGLVNVCWELVELLLLGCWVTGEEALFSGTYSQPGLVCHMATALQNIQREVQLLVRLTTQLIYVAFAVSPPAYAYRKQGKPNSKHYFLIDYKVQAGRQT